MRKLVLKNSQSPGDIVMLTAAVRDLHRSYPGQFVTSVRIPCGHLRECSYHISNRNAQKAQSASILWPQPMEQHEQYGRFLLSKLGTKNLCGYASRI